jgi:hypothetical protein
MHRALDTRRGCRPSLLSAAHFDLQRRRYSGVPILRCDLGSTAVPFVISLSRSATQEFPAEYEGSLSMC